MTRSTCPPHSHWAHWRYACQPSFEARLLRLVPRDSLGPRKTLDFPHHLPHPLGIHKRSRQLRTGVCRQNFAGHAPQTTDFRLAPKRVVLVALRFLAVEHLQPAAVHLHTRHGWYRLIGGRLAPLRDRQRVVGRGLSVTLCHAFVADALRRAAHAFGRNLQFRQRFQVARALRETGRLCTGIDHLLPSRRAIVILRVQTQ